MHVQFSNVDYRVSVRVDGKTLISTTPAQYKPDVSALLRETQTIPIVFIGVTDPIGGGFVTSLSRPGGNLTVTSPRLDFKAKPKI